MGEAKRRKLAGTYPDQSPKRPFLARHDSDEGMLSFQAALDYARSEKAGAYAFVPERRGSVVIGGEVWVISFDPEPDGEDNELCVST